MGSRSLRTTARIGIVDDDPSIGRALDLLLRSHGYLCDVYHSAEELVADPKMPEFDCLVLDIHLPGMDGFELRDFLRMTGSHVPHVFITAQMDDDSSDWSSRMSDSPYLTKPFEEIQLLTFIKALLKQEHT